MIRIIKKHNLGIRKNKVKESDIPKIREMYINGFGSKAIGKEFGYNHVTVLKICEDIKRDYRGSNTTRNKNKAIELFNKGLSKKEIAKEMNESSVNIRNWLKSSGLCLIFPVKNKRPRVINYNRSNFPSDVKIIKSYLRLGVNNLVADELGIHRNKVSEILSKYKIMKTIKPKEIIPAEISRDMLGKGFERGKVKEVKLREDRDSGRLVKFKYSDLSDYPTVLAEIRVKDGVSNQEAIDRWGKNHNKKSWKLV